MQKFINGYSGFTLPFTTLDTSSNNFIILKRSVLLITEIKPDTRIWVTWKQNDR